MNKIRTHFTLLTHSSQLTRCSTTKCFTLLFTILTLFSAFCTHSTNRTVKKTASKNPLMFLLCSCLMIIITGQILYFTKTCTTAHYTKTKPNHHHSMHHHKNNSRVNTSSTTAHLNALLCL